MAQTCKGPPAGQAGEPKELHSFSGVCNPPISPKPSAAQAKNPAVAAAFADLTLESSVEAAHIASVTARHFGEQIELGDQLAAEHSLPIAASHLREAIGQFTKWRALKAGARQ